MIIVGINPETFFCESNLRINTDSRLAATGAKSKNINIKAVTFRVFVRLISW